MIRAVIDRPVVEEEVAVVLVLFVSPTEHIEPRHRSCPLRWMRTARHRDSLPARQVGGHVLILDFQAIPLPGCEDRGMDPMVAVCPTKLQAFIRLQFQSAFARARIVAEDMTVIAGQGVAM